MEPAPSITIARTPSHPATSYYYTKVQLLPKNQSRLKGPAWSKLWLAGISRARRSSVSTPQRWHRAIGSVSWVTDARGQDSRPCSSWRAFFSIWLRGNGGAVKILDAEAFIAGGEEWSLSHPTVALCIYTKWGAVLFRLCGRFWCITPGCAYTHWISYLSSRSLRDDDRREYPSALIPRGVEDERRTKPRYRRREAASL